MYKICIPIMNKYYDDTAKAALVRELKRINPDIVFLVFSRIICDDKSLNDFKEMYISNMQFLQNNGFKVGAWLAPTIGYGSEHWGENGARDKFTRIRSIDGKLSGGGFCPLDEGFVYEFLKIIKTIAELGIKDILFEDEFT